MNKSFSKRRHIQEANQRLERMFLIEQDTNTTKPNTRVTVTKYSNGQPIEGSNGNAVIVRKLDDGTTLARLFIGGFQYYVRLQNNNNEYTVLEVAKLAKRGAFSIQFFESTRKPTQMESSYIVVDLTSGKEYGVVDMGNGAYEFYLSQIPLKPVTATNTAPEQSNANVGSTPSQPAAPNQPATTNVGTGGTNQSKYVRCNDSTGYGFGCFSADANKIKAVQKCLGLKQDGYWGKQTQAEISKVRTTVKQRYTSDELKGLCDDIIRSKNTTQTNTTQPRNRQGTVQQLPTKPITSQRVTMQTNQDEFSNKIQ